MDLDLEDHYTATVETDVYDGGSVRRTIRAAGVTRGGSARRSARPMRISNRPELVVLVEE